MDISFDRIRDDEGKLCQGNWQVIFRNAQGQDYCRETQPGKLTESEIMEWTRAMLQQHKQQVSSAIIERW